MATSAAGWINALLLIHLLQRRGQFALDPRGAADVPRMVAASLGMGAVVLALEPLLAPAFAGGLALRLVALATLVGAGLVAFAVLAVALGALPWREVKQRLWRARAT